MIFARTKPQYPTAWKMRFALLPVVIGEENGRRYFLWLAPYEARWKDDYHLERRTTGEGAKPYALEPWWC